MTITLLAPHAILPEWGRANRARIDTTGVVTRVGFLSSLCSAWDTPMLPMPRLPAGLSDQEEWQAAAAAIAARIGSVGLQFTNYAWYGLPWTTSYSPRVAAYAVAALQMTRHAAFVVDNGEPTSPAVEAQDASGGQDVESSSRWPEVLLKPSAFLRLACYHSAAYAGLRKRAEASHIRWMELDGAAAAVSSDFAGAALSAWTSNSRSNSNSPAGEGVSWELFRDVLVLALRAEGSQPVALVWRNPEVLAAGDWRTFTEAVSALQAALHHAAPSTAAALLVGDF
ncbi:MAG: hypothetical protein KGJ62_05380 [Armatimonadetes bacterium]|nr:hypothetical protein [Armatimonadota bacterium]MDE2206646.1 hypothetical protein [Armatimonadota bacterium]